MSSSFKIVLLLALFVSSEPSWATNKVGNGGSVVSCQNKSEKKADIRLLDFYEGDVTFETNDKHDTAGAENFQALAATRFEKLKEISPKLGKQYQRRLNQIMDEIDFKDDVELTKIPDSEHLFSPKSKDCRVLQVAIRKAVKTDKEKRFLIQKDLWDQMKPVQRAGLLSHEIVYEHLSKLGETTSVKARKINSLLFSANLTKQEFWKTIKDLQLPIYPD